MGRKNIPEKNQFVLLKNYYSSTGTGAPEQQKGGGKKKEQIWVTLK